METFIGILVLAAIFGLVVLWGKAKDAASKKLNQNVFSRGAHQRGQDAVNRTLDFTLAETPERVIAHVRSGIGLPEGPQSAVLGKAYIAEVTDRTMILRSGSKIGTSFSALLAVHPAPGGSTGAYTVTNWKLVDGIVSDAEQMDILFEKVRSLIAQLDPQARITVS